ncbi:hypothetical protein HU200_011016 [Digitaria exilis]|uniref:Glutaredoxin domain-containing protein n=1 Tax=Digitaria exilis TaxID=1010633 RepID=A0A835KPG6_9POAL|nr:hypothetical protein HU200_011016 [Digitaria exilis]
MGGLQRRRRRDRRRRQEAVPVGAVADVPPPPGAPAGGGQVAEAAARGRAARTAAAGGGALHDVALRGVRRTFTDCSAVRAILRGFRVAVDERDVSMDAAFRRDLQALLAVRGRAFALPQLLIGGRLVGGADEVRQLHESGQLRRLLDGAAGQDPGLRLRRLRRRPLRPLHRLRRQPQGLRRGGGPGRPLRRVQRERIGETEREEGPFGFLAGFGVYPIILKIGFASHGGEEHIVLDSLLKNCHMVMVIGE